MIKEVIPRFTMGIIKINNIGLCPLGQKGNKNQKRVLSGSFTD